MKDYTNILDWSDEQILDEIKDIRYLYRLKGVIRYNIPRDEEFLSETVAEHVYGMLTLARYFLKLEDKSLNEERILQLILWHDADEIETNDIPTHLKTSTDVQNAQDALSEVYKKVPQLLQEDIMSLIKEYGDLETKESRFVKALDKLEPSFHLFSEEGRKMLVEGMGFTEEQFNYVEKNKFEYTKEFPIINRFQIALENYQRTHNYFN